MSTTDDILAMLDQVSEQQFRCAICGRNDDLYIASVDMLTRVAGARYDGKLGVDTDTDTDYISTPREVLPIQEWVLCGNTKLHEHTEAIVPDGVIVHGHWAWHPVPDDRIDWNTPYHEIQTLRGFDPDC